MFEMRRVKHYLCTAYGVKFEMHDQFAQTGELTLNEERHTRRDGAPHSIAQQCTCVAEQARHRARHRAHGNIGQGDNVKGVLDSLASGLSDLCNYYLRPKINVQV